MSLVLYTPLESLVKRQLRSPFLNPDSKKLIVHCCYHKVGTAWFIRILSAVARYYGLKFQQCHQSYISRDTDIFLEYGSQVQPSKLPYFLGSHMIRDPRDIVISAYFYHLWTKEEWANIPQSGLSGKTYKEYLNSFNQEAGLLAEMEGISKEIIESMTQWDYSNPYFFEIRYEDIIRDEETTFYQIFKHYGFHEEAIQICLSIASKFSFKNKSKRKLGQVKGKSHLRSGQPKQWASMFTDTHKKRFKELFGNVLIKLGYEVDNNW